MNRQVEFYLSVFHKVRRTFKEFLRSKAEILFNIRPHYTTFLLKLDCIINCFINEM